MFVIYDDKKFYISIFSLKHSAWQKIQIPQKHESNLVSKLSLLSEPFKSGGEPRIHLFIYDQRELFLDESELCSRQTKNWKHEWNRLSLISILMTRACGRLFEFLE